MPPSAWTGSERFRGFCVALDEAGLALDERYVRRNQRTVAAAEAAALEVLGLVEPPRGAVLREQPEHDRRDPRRRA